MCRGAGAGAPALGGSPGPGATPLVAPRGVLRVLCVKHPCTAPGGYLAVPVVCPVEGMEVLEMWGWMVWVTCSPPASTLGRCRMGCHGAELCFHLLRGLLGYFQDSPHPQGGFWCFSSAERENLVLPVVLEVHVLPLPPQLMGREGKNVAASCAKPVAPLAPCPSPCSALAVSGSGGAWHGDRGGTWWWELV